MFIKPDAANRKKVSRILGIDGQLFVARGFATTLLHSIRSKATVNLAAVNYHFVGCGKLLVQTGFSRFLERYLPAG